MEFENTDSASTPEANAEDLSAAPGVTGLPNHFSAEQLAESVNARLTANQPSGDNAAPPVAPPPEEALPAPPPQEAQPPAQPPENLIPEHFREKPEVKIPTTLAEVKAAYPRISNEHAQAIADANAGQQAQLAALQQFGGEAGLQALAPIGALMLNASPHIGDAHAALNSLLDAAPQAGEALANALYADGLFSPQPQQRAAAHEDLLRSMLPQHVSAEMRETVQSMNGLRLPLAYSLDEIEALYPAGSVARDLFTLHYAREQGFLDVGAIRDEIRESELANPQNKRLMDELKELKAGQAQSQERDEAAAKEREAAALQAAQNEIIQPLEEQTTRYLSQLLGVPDNAPPDLKNASAQVTEMVKDAIETRLRRATPFKDVFALQRQGDTKSLRYNQAKDNALTAHRGIVVKAAQEGNALLTRLIGKTPNARLQPSATPAGGQSANFAPNVSAPQREEIRVPLTAERLRELTERQMDAGRRQAV